MRTSVARLFRAVSTSVVLAVVAGLLAGVPALGVGAGPVRPLPAGPAGLRRARAAAPGRAGRHGPQLQPGGLRSQPAGLAAIAIKSVIAAGA